MRLFTNNTFRHQRIKPPINWPLSGREWLHRSALFTLPRLISSNVGGSIGLSIS